MEQTEKQIWNKYTPPFWHPTTQFPTLFSKYSSSDRFTPFSFSTGSHSMELICFPQCTSSSFSKFTFSPSLVNRYNPIIPPSVPQTTATSSPLFILLAATAVTLSPRSIFPTSYTSSHHHPSSPYSELSFSRTELPRLHTPISTRRQQNRAGLSAPRHIAVPNNATMRFLECQKSGIAIKEKIEKYRMRGSNSRPLACEASVIATTPTRLLL